LVEGVGAVHLFSAERQRGHGSWIAGQLILNALIAFNMNQLVTFMAGTKVGWDSSGTPGGAVTDTQPNTIMGVVKVLQDQHVIP
jgi:hypothetical protein